MLVRNKLLLEKFIARHANARIPISEWVLKTEAARWRNFTEVKATFNSADYCSPFVIFDIAGNKYRLLAEINYLGELVRIAKIGTHSTYSRWRL